MDYVTQQMYAVPNMEEEEEEDTDRKLLAELGIVVDTQGSRTTSKNDAPNDVSGQDPKAQEASTKSQFEDTTTTTRTLATTTHSLLQSPPRYECDYGHDILYVPNTSYQ